MTLATFTVTDRIYPVTGKKTRYHTNTFYQPWPLVTLLEDHVATK